MPADTVIVFGRVPELGRVKTRLAAQVGDERALDLYRRMLEHSLTVAQASGRSVELCIEGVDRDGECARLASRYGAMLTAQSGGDLGERMHGAFVRALRHGAAAVLIGSDCHALAVEDLHQAFAALAGHDAVFSPAEDGGYLLVDLARPRPEIFRGPAWGSAQVMEQTRKRLGAAGARWVELRTLWDVDRAEDLDRWSRAIG